MRQVAGAPPAAWKRYLPPALLCLVVLAGLLPAITTTYALSDDYAYLYWSNAGAYQTFYDVCILYGRPLLGPILLPPYLWLDTLSQLVALRSIGVFGAVVLAFLGARLLARETKLGPLLCGTFGLLLALNPGTAYQAMWAACFPYPLCASVALLAGYDLARKLAPGPLPGRGPRLAGCILAIYLILNIYQPSALVALIGGLLTCLSGTGRDRILRPLIFLGILGGVFSTYYLLTKHALLPLIFGDHLPSYATRYGLNLNISAVVSFAVDIFARGLAFWSDLDGGFYKILFILLVVLLVVTGIWTWGGGQWRAFFIQVGIFALFLGFALAPLIVNSERAYFCRTMVAFYGLISVPMIFGIDRLLGRNAGVFAFRKVAVILLVVALFAGSAFYYTRQSARNAQWEQSILREVAREAIAPDTKSVVFVRPPHRSMRRTPRLNNGDTWGMMSSWVEMFPKPMLQEIVDEQFGGKNRAPQLTVYSVTRKDPRPPADLTIDGPSLFGQGTLGATGPLKKSKAPLRKLIQEL